MRKTLIAGNWKMNTSINEGVELAKGLVEFTNNYKELSSNNSEKNLANKSMFPEVLICVPFTSLYAIKQIVKDSNVKLGAQNMYFEEKGAFTGEISPLMLNDIGVEYCLIGHSERRQYFKEENALLNKKVKSALSHGIKPILCVGETLEQREQGIEKEVIKTQIEEALIGINASDMDNVVIAYEPVWAIGTGKTATSEQAQEVISFIRQTVKKLYNSDTSDNLIIQYGGSVKGSNASEIMSKSDIDGALVGGASLKLDEFIKIINY